MTVDLNADVGEGCADDVALFDIVSSANVACGGHAGDDASMRATVLRAKSRGVAVGAHPSYRDREHFGRRDVHIDRATLYRDLREQIAALADIAAREGVALHHVKAHGALYNAAAGDRAIADVVSQAVAEAGIAMLYGLAGGAQIESARAFGLQPVAEGFADRRYRADGTLVPRGEPAAMIEDEAEAVAQVRELLRTQRAQTICVHGDNPHAVAFARSVRKALQDGGMTIAAVR